MQAPVAPVPNGVFAAPIAPVPNGVFAAPIAPVAPAANGVFAAPIAPVAPAPNGVFAAPIAPVAPAPNGGAHAVAHTGARHAPAHSGVGEARRADPEAGGKRKRAILIVAVVIVLIGAASLAYLTLAGDDGGSGTSAAGSRDAGPVGAVTRFLSGVQEKDYDLAVAEVCPQTGITAAQLGAVFEQQFGDGIDSFQVDQPAPTEAGKPVLVTYRLTIKGQTSGYQASVATPDGRACITENRRVG